MSTIVRYECPDCGRTDLGEARFNVHEHFVEDPREGSKRLPTVCTGVRVKKTYVDVVEVVKLIDSLGFAWIS